MPDAALFASNRVIFLAAVAMLLSAVLARSLTVLATRIGLVDLPGGRKQHEGVIPVTGGIAMYIGFAVAVLAGDAGATPALALVVALGVLVFCGLADDLHDLSPKAKFLLQIAAALLMTSWAGVQVGQLGDLMGFGVVQLHGWAIPFTVVCALGTINAMNMLDGLDGSAGGTALVATLWLACAAWLQRLAPQAVLLLFLAGAIAGFLAWNLRMPWRRHAVVFMGDAGSMMLGFALCWFTIDLSQGAKRSMPPIACVWVLAVPLIDMARVMFVRVLRRSGLFGADREHLHHFLLARGYSVQAAAGIMVVASAICGGIGVGAWRYGVPDAAMFYAFAVLVGAILARAYARELRIRAQNGGQR
ncbi:MAG: undecaprenyl/decaprenyl-phosphate alpha-N-acetylglucosaminyl 1-phosphate transferase [Betaproteobacteria bacterium]|nr:undecaprenyl/decaprenyl-phosphate alpha-N-acetylglucosaminyl 1-phosphate transferase [Betaproteobacteria bacterium]